MNQSTASADPILKISNIESYYGPIMAIRGVSIEAPRGKIVTLLGANGAGKTTLLRAISGLVRRTGEIKLEGRAIINLPTEDIARLGVAHVPEGRGLFPAMSVEENLRLGGIVRRDAQSVAKDMERVYSYFPWLKERRAQQAGALSGGEQQMLAVARAVMQRPRLLLLDEPSFGLAPRVVAEMFSILRALTVEKSLSILLVEQNAKLALDFADDGYVLDGGRVALAGPSRELIANAAVRRAYLGE